MTQIRYEKILIPHDGSSVASAILPHVLALEGGFNAKIVLVEVVDPLLMLTAQFESAPAFSPGLTTIELVNQIAKYQRQAAEANLQKVKKQLQAFGISDIKSVIVEGSPGDEIVKVAKKEDCDLILMSTHGRTGIGRILMGSVADYVIRYAHCPVLIVRPKE